MRPARPFIVEVKHKRGAHSRENSIWGDLDLSAIAAETESSAETKKQADARSGAATLESVDFTGSQPSQTAPEKRDANR